MKIAIGSDTVMPDGDDAPAASKAGAAEAVEAEVVGGDGGDADPWGKKK
jgi:hypothetical protein